MKMLKQHLTTFNNLNTLIKELVIDSLPNEIQEVTTINRHYIVKEVRKELLPAQCESEFNHIISVKKKVWKAQLVSG